VSQAPVLVLDDNLFFRPRLETELRTAGFTPVFAVGAAGFRSALDAEPGAVVVNLASRGFDAPALVAEAHARFPALPIIGFGPHTDESLVASGLAAGCVEVVPNGLVVRAAGRLVAQRRATTE
jgi:DNA-binding NtrC family response regulator